MNGIRAGVRHLHSLGLAHNDLNPTNFALDSDDNPIILDFGSCKKFGEELLSAGTHGWIDEDYFISAQQHDETAMRKIEAWLIEEKRKRQREDFEKDT
jgi:serine/threonine protein kinase